MDVEREEDSGNAEVPWLSASKPERSATAKTTSIPWTAPTRQEEGRATEKRELRKRGARQHPRSGAGTIKEDGSTQECLYEIKDARKAFQLNAKDLQTSRRRAIQQDKQAVWIITFANGITAEVYIGN